MELHSIAGQKVRYLMQENPMLFEDAVERELQGLQRQADEEAPFDETREKASTVEGFGDLQRLRARMREVRRSERSKAAAELLHLMVCDGFQRRGVRMVAPISRAGVVRFGDVQHGALTTHLHSPEALAAVEHHLSQTLRDGHPPGGIGPDVQTDLLLQLLLFSIGQAYATTALFGYVLRRAEQRFRLDGIVQPPAAHGAEGAAPLLKYIDEAIGPGEFQNKMLFVESNAALQARVHGLFGDMHDLKQETLGKAGHPSGLQAAVKADQVPNVKLSAGDFRRLLLESVAFGCLLQEAEQQVEQRFSLTPASHAGLDEFGLPTKSSGSPLFPH